MIPVVFGGDPGKLGAYAILRGEELVGYGEARNAEERSHAVHAFRRACLGDIVLAPLGLAVPGAPFHAVIEMHTRGSKPGRGGKGLRWGFETIYGMGSQRGRWLEQLQLAGLPVARTHGVTPREWRKVLAPLPRNTTEQAVASSITFVRAKFGITVGPDVAAAVCICWWWRWSNLQVERQAHKTAGDRRAGQ